MHYTGQTCPICRERIGDGHACGGTPTFSMKSDTPGIDTGIIHQAPLLKEITQLNTKLEKSNKEITHLQNVNTALEKTQRRIEKSLEFMTQRLSEKETELRKTRSLLAYRKGGMK